MVPPIDQRLAGVWLQTLSPNREELTMSCETEITWDSIKNDIIEIPMGEIPAETEAPSQPDGQQPPFAPDAPVPQGKAEVAPAAGAAFVPDSITHVNFPTDARGAAPIYLAKGSAPIPVQFGSKTPVFANWANFLLTKASLELHFPPDRPCNIGILNGVPSNNRVDVDLDCDEAVLAARELLPNTGWIFGRKSRPGSHWNYQVDASTEKARETYSDLGPDGPVLVELLGTGSQTVFPPSIHKDTGERITWEKFTDPGEISLTDLRIAVKEVAAAALLARHWPAKGSRDSAAMALAGGLARAGWNDVQISRFIYAVAVAANDEEARARARKALPTLRKQVDGQKTTGWPALENFLGDHGKEVVRYVRDWLGLAVPAQIAYLTPEAPAWPAPPGDEAFYGLPGRIVRAIEPTSESDPVALLIQFLIAFGNAAGRSAHFQVEANCHYCNEYALIVGRTAKARKGTSFGRVLDLWVPVDSEWVEKRIVSGVSSGEGIIDAVRDPIIGPERIREGGEVRYEDVEKDPGIQDKRLLLYESEFANVFTQIQRQGNSVSVVLREAWDGRNTLRTLTKNSKSIATGAHISLIGHITDEELRRRLTQTDIANGFGNRFMFVAAQRSKLLPEGGFLDRAVLHPLREELVAVLEFAKSIGAIARDPDALKIWRAVYGELSEGKPGLAGALMARGEAHVMRLALIYALLDKAREIKPPHLMAAIALWDYCERSVHFIFGDSLGDPVADELLRLLKGCPNGLTRTEMRDYFQRHASSDRISRALGLLLQHRLARKQEEQTGGRPAERWFAVEAEPRHLALVA
jgi:hypothetical protein